MKTSWRFPATVTAALVLLLAAGSALAGDITGAARPVAGDTIDVAGQRIRLAAIDAPERSQTCTSGVAFTLVHPTV